MYVFIDIGYGRAPMCNDTAYAPSKTSSWHDLDADPVHEGAFLRDDTFAKFQRIQLADIEHHL
jgi:hypothetical protein